MSRDWRVEANRENKVEQYMDDVEWHDVAGWTDAESTLAQILGLMDKGKTDEALDIKDDLKRRWAIWMVENE